jgi:hypothetical protein
MMYLARVVRSAGRTVRHIIRADTPTHGVLRDRLVGIALISIMFDLICAVLILLFERGEAQTQIHTYGDALFWTTTQLLTVSSQIQNPFSTGGRIVDVLMEGYAMVVVATVTGSLGAFLIRRAHEAEQAKAKALAQATSGS